MFHPEETATQTSARKNKTLDRSIYKTASAQYRYKNNRVITAVMFLDVNQ